MDKELALLEDWAVEQIIEWKELLEKQTRATGKAPSDLKRALRFGNELVFNPEAYGNLLERARSQGLSAKQIIQEIRKIETELLNSKKVLMSDWLHHRTAQRTGGDTFLYMRGDARRAAREILRGEGIYLGNVDPNFVSLPGVLHTKKTQGVEKKWFDSLSFDQQKGLYLPAEQGGSGLTPAHLTGASSAQISGTAPTPGLLTAEEGADVVRESALLQRGETAAAEKIMFESGYVEEARKQIGQPGLYTPEGPTRQLVTSEEAVPIFNRLLNFNGGKLHLDKEVLQQMASFPNRLMQEAQGMQTIQQINQAIQNPAARRFGAAVPFVGAGLGAAFVGANRQARLEEIQQNPQDPTLKANLVLDELSGQADRATLAGAALLPTPAAPVGAAMIGAGELTSTVTGVTSLVIDGGRAFIKSIFNPPKREEQKLVPDLPNLR